ncbi:MAG: hypothetical protein ABI408_07695 [Gemmatimonadaceae bacterium]
MRLNTRWTIVFAIAGVAVMGRAVAAQVPDLPKLHPSYYGSAEADTRSAQFYLLGMYVGMGGLGWSPYFNINGYLDHYPIAGAAARSLSAVSPTAGLAYAGRTDGVSFGAGYAWVHNPDSEAPGAEGGNSNGLTASFGAYHNARGSRPMHAQLLSNYNFGSKYLWARGRASVPYGRSTAHPARVGIELVGQGGGDGALTTNTLEAGPTLEYAATENLRLTGVVGYKSVGGSALASRESAAYLKLEFSFSP